MLSQTSEADSDLTGLIYSGLFKYNGEGKIENDLADDYEISEDQKTYTVRLKKNIFWHDGRPLTASDVFFTVSILQDPAYKSPLRQNWQGIGVNQIDDYTLSFNLNNPYFGFFSNLTVGILPKHIWENITPEKFSLADYNLKPIGSGPYEFVNFQKNSNGEILAYNLRAFGKYFKDEPYISQITFNFYPDEDRMLAAYNKKEIKGMENINPEKIPNIKNKKTTAIRELSFPRYFAIFLNQNKSIPLANDEVRKALAYSVDRGEIINKVLYGKGAEIYAPFLSSMDEYNNDSEKKDFNIDEANKILDEAGWKFKEGETVKEKNGTKLQFKIYTTDWPDLSETANILAKQWQNVGADVIVDVLSVSDLQQNFIRPREYEALLFGQDSSFNPDLYPFWHSSQKQDGFNLGMLDNKDADAILQNIKQEPDSGRRVELYREFQKILAKENSAIFIYSPYYLYPISSDIKGFETTRVNSPSWRFSDINKWYIKTTRVRK
ncbi:MAG: ABC transporter substrate-binding protein [bacterium]|nr:ABC transporter substrate-binding protein [bacterium]